MGQKVGKCKYVDVAQTFTNLPQTAMTELWEAFNDIAEGFGLTCGEFQDIILVLQDYLELKKPDLELVAKEIFEAIDTDKNELIDALEFLGTFALASGMDIEDKILFVFNCYDFDESGELTIDEMTLSMKSTLTGLAKLTDIKTPKELELEAISQQAFLQADKNKDSKISRSEFLAYCKRTPEVRTWLAYFDDTADNAVSQVIVDSDIERECRIVDRPREIIAARNLEDSIETIFQYEAESLDPKFSVVKPWMGVIVDPTEMPKDNHGQPDSNLELEWIHGYRSADVRNNLRYSDRGEIVYHAGAAGVVYNASEHSQRFNLDHSDEVLCLAMHPSGEIVATGEAGPMPRIVIWEVLTGKALVSISGHHRRAVTHLAFSPDGELLSSVGGDADHSVAVYNWNAPGIKKVFAEKNTKLKVLDMCFRDNTTFVTCGVDHIYFWRRNGKTNTFEKKKGLFGKKGKLQPIVCCAPTPDAKFIITGTASGHLYTWATRNCKAASKAHDRNVNALYTFPAGLISGGKDGKVRLWRYVSGGKISAGASFDVASLLSYSPQVRSVCADAASTKILVGTQGSEIYEMSMADGSSLHDGPLVQGHYKNELSGVAVNPIKVSEFATVGDDAVVRVWDFATRKLIKKTKIDCPGRAITYSSNGKSIVVGLGTDNSQNEKLCGGFLVLNETDLTVIHEARDSKKQISDIKFSPSGAVMAVASHDNNIYLYNSEDGEYSARGKCRGHSAPVTHIDFSDDGKWLQSNSADFSLMYWDTEDGEQKKSAHALKDVEWASWTCPLGWPVQALWPTFQDGLDISAVHRSSSGKVLATTDQFGRVTITNYPCTKKGAGSKIYFGHAIRCNNVRFSVDDRFVVTTGGTDHCIFQWKHIVDGFEEEAEKYDIDADSEDEIDAIQGENLDRNPDLEDANKLDMFQLFTFEEGKAADDAIAVKPWWGSVVAPSAPPKPNLTQTNHEMNLEWVYGYRSQGTRNNVKYLSSGEIAYPAAKLGIVLNKDAWVQKYNTEHSDEVISLAVHPEGRYVATGQLGKKPVINVWDSSTMETVISLSGFHRRGVSLLAFSADGKYLVSVGEDVDHSMVIYNWRDGRIESYTKCGTNKVLDVQFSPDGRSLVQVGVDHVKFHSIHGRNVSTLKGIIGKKGRIQNIICVGWVKQDKKDVCVTGTQDGHLYVWEGRKLVKPVKAHERNINAIHSVPEGICTGGKDGKIKLWDHNLECIQEFDIVELDIALSPRIRSVCWHPGANKILVGTRAAEIFELSAVDGSDINHGPLIQGHYYDESWGLAIHPSKPEFATVGDDMTLRIFAMASRKLIRRQKLACISRAVAYSPDGGKIAIGYGGKAGQGKQKKDGTFIILRESTLEVLHEARDSKQWITDIKFTPDGTTLGVGSYDNCIYLYDVPNGFSLKAKFDRHNSFITHFDFSTDSQYMMSNCGAYELLFSDATNGALIPAPSSLKDTDWSTQNCVLSWATQGTWTAYADGTDISACDRSAAGDLLASGDEFGRLRLWRWPAVNQTAGYKSYNGHGPGIRKVLFTPGDNYLISLGATDRCAFQWKMDAFDDIEEGIEAGDSGNDSALEIGNVVVEADADQFMAVRPWVGSIVPPTDKPMEVLTPPSVAVELDFVQGYRSYDARNNCRYNDAGEIIYHTSTLGIIYNKPQHAQKFFRDHKMNILSLTIDVSGKYVASAESARRPLIRIWDSQTGTEIACLREFHRRGISCLEFSPDGKHLMSVGQDIDHEVAVWSTSSGEWYDARLLAHEKSGREKVLFCTFIKNSTRFQIMTGGVKAVKFWRLNSGTLRPKPGIFGRKGKLQPIMCAANIGDHLVTGSVSGHLYIWRVDSRTIVKAIKAHDKTINSLYSRKTALAEFLVSGGKDGVVKLWSLDLECLQTFNVAEISPPPYNASIRSVCIDQNGNTLLVGTHGAEIYEISNGTGATLITQAHCSYELWGLAMHPTDPNIYATCGDDKSIRVWDITKRKMIKMAVLDSMARCIAWHPSGNMLAAGLGGAGGRGRQKKDGAFIVIDYETMNIRHEARDSREWISDIKFSPDGNTLGLGSHDNKIYLYDVTNDFALKAKCEKHASYITHFDFSADNAYLQSNCGAYELFFFSAADGSHIVSPSLLKDTEWATWTCPLGWPVQGIWPLEADGTEINAVDRCKNKETIACVDEQGRLTIRKYPALSKKAETIVLHGHASHITNVRFNADDQYLLTVGGGDRAILIWKVKKLQEPMKKTVL